MRKLVITLLLLIIGAGVAAASDTKAPGAEFQDCKHCPVMVVIPPGKFMMGAHPKQKKWPYELAWHSENISYTFAVGKFELLLSEYYQCVEVGACTPIKKPNPGILSQLPAYNLSWDQAEAYVTWLAKKTGKAYRLLSHSEWEYAARAGTDTVYWWGDTFKKDMAICAGCSSAHGWIEGTAAKDGHVFTYRIKAGHYINPVGGEHAVPANPFGLYFMLGNVREWVQDCFHPHGGDRPENGAPWIDGGDCSKRTVMGHDFNDRAADLKMGEWGIVGRSVQYVPSENTGTRIALTIK